MSTIKKLQLLLMILLGYISYAQERKIENADKLYESNCYIDALKIYERVANKGFISAEMLQKLGDSYYFNGLLNDANKWYELLFGLKVEILPEYYFRYSQTLKSLQDYDKANEMMSDFTNMAENETRSKLYMEKEDYLSQIKTNSGNYIVKSLNINSAFSDFGPAFFGNNIVFSSNRDNSSMLKRIDKWTNSLFSDLYVVKFDSVSKLPFGSTEILSKNIKTRFHKSTAVFTKDGKTMYFTGSAEKTKESDKKDLIHLKIYRADLVDDKWSDINELSFNGQNCSNAHPALSPDEKMLYFSSDREGGFGLSDIYRVKILENREYGEVESLGNKINTEGRETFPFIAESGELYFASDGHPGLGGLDVFVSPGGNGRFVGVYNLGEPINSELDDFSFIIENEKRKGFFSSNRSGGKGLDDMYALEELKRMQYLSESVLTATFVDDVTNEAVGNATVQLYDSNFKLIDEIKTDSSGKCKFDVTIGDYYYVRLQNDGYVTKEVGVLIKNIPGGTKLSIKSERKIVEIGIDTELFKIFKMTNIYFSFDKIDINSDDEADLHKIIEVMKMYPSIKLDIRSHTDSRGSKEYNMKLSNRRVNAIISYLVKKGISKERLSGKGYGKSQLINKCNRGIKCSLEQHRQNRRCEFVITAM